MNIEEYQEFCLSLKGVTEETPFGPDTLVYKVMGKVFTIAGMEPFKQVTVKCDPETALELRERYLSVKPGYHTSKKHWNTIAVNGELSTADLQHWILHSYNLVVQKLPEKLLQQLRAMQ